MANRSSADHDHNDFDELFSNNHSSHNGSYNDEYHCDGHIYVFNHVDGDNCVLVYDDYDEYLVFSDNLYFDAGCLDYSKSNRCVRSYGDTCHIHIYCSDSGFANYCDGDSHRGNRVDELHIYSICASRKFDHNLCDSYPDGFCFNDQRHFD